MPQNDLNELKDIIEKNNRQLTGILEVLNERVKNLELVYSVSSKMIGMMQDQQSIMNKKIDGMHKEQTEIKMSLDANTASVLKMEATFKGYGDMYKINADNVLKLDKRIRETEKDLGIEPSPELLVGR